MECEVCGIYTTINWGNSYAVRCKEHASHDEEVKIDPSAFTGQNRKPVGPVSQLVIIYIVELVLLIPWLPFAALAAMAYDSGKIWPAILLVGPFHAYPLLILIGIVSSIIAYKKGKYRIANVLAISPMIISFGWMMLLYTISSLVRGFGN